VRHVPEKGRKAFFSEEKKQKTFIRWRVRSPGSTRQSPKVFWFFFSKKNILPSTSPQNQSGQRRHRQRQRSGLIVHRMLIGPKLPAIAHAGPAINRSIRVHDFLP
jgi:hypothetical protein